MDSQKYENMLNLALDVTEEVRENSGTLDVGFNALENTWEVIIRYSGDIEFLRTYNVNITYLISNYAILDVPDGFIRRLSDFREIIYVEMPKSLYLSVNNGRRVSCISQVQTSDFSVSGGLYGENVICACIDSGIDIYHNAFRNSDGTTRILELWDQNIDGNPPGGYSLGSVFNSNEINEALQRENSSLIRNFPSVDVSGHGTHVAGIMAGNFAENKNNDIGIATRSPLVIVKLNTAINNGYPRTTEMMLALNYVYQTAVKYGMPVSINLSFGNSYGSHDGTSLLETFIDDLSNLWKMCICIGTGNEGASAGHYKEVFRNGERKRAEFTVGEYENSINIQLWKTYEDTFRFELIPPGNLQTISIENVRESTNVRIGNDNILIYYGEPSPYSRFQEIYIQIVPDSRISYYITSGIWSVNIEAINVVSGQIDMWLPDSAALNADTRFITPTPDTTLTIPSTSYSAISVGGYNSLTFSYADFSGRGFTRLDESIKPEIVAPAVNIVSAAVGGGVTEKSGTSMACPFVAGSAALLMEWGIIRGNDPYLYGNKAKAYLIRGAMGLPSEPVPSEKQGFGRLCLVDSIP